MNYKLFTRHRLKKMIADYALQNNAVALAHRALLERELKRRDRRDRRSHRNQAGKSTWIWITNEEIILKGTAVCQYKNYRIIIYRQKYIASRRQPTTQRYELMQVITQGSQKWVRGYTRLSDVKRAITE